MLHWRSLSDGLLVSLVICGPTLFASLILRDQHEQRWALPLLVAAVGFLVGGAIAGRHRRLRRGSMAQGVALGLMIATAILLANLVRTLVLAKGVTFSTASLWVAVEFGSVLLASIGALIGRRRFWRSRKRKLGH
jgi:hypothetical protein